jgi:predicted thioredoxin/glutaredoxin
MVIPKEFKRKIPFIFLDGELWYDGPVDEINAKIYLFL